jgi:hypothetical protein
MTPLEKIKTGIERGQFKLVADGYFDLTGVKVSYPKVIIPTGELPTVTVQLEKFDHEKLDKAIKQTIDKKIDEYDTENFRMPRNTTQTTDIKGRKCKAVPINTNKIQTVGNIFEDTKEDVPSDSKEYLIKDRVKRNRETVKFKTFVCTKCNEEYSLHPDVITQSADKFICDACIPKMRRK